MTALTPRQDRFVRAYCGHLNASRAAREAGYSSSSGADAVTGHRLLRLDKVQGAIRAVQKAQAVQLEITRQELLWAVLEAIEAARQMSKPAVMISGWREIAKILGLYDSQKRHVSRESPDGDMIRRKLESLPTNVLLEMVADKRLLCTTAG